MMNDNRVHKPSLRHRAKGAVLAARQALREPVLTPESEHPRDEHPRKIELAKKAYDEVLDATKHQDDKVGRFLTAIAFLTTGAIALIAQDEGLRRRYDLPGGSDYPLLAWSTGAFFVLTIAAVALLLLCLSVPVRLPQSRRDPMKGSHLFYSYIAARPSRDWRNEWEKCAACLESDITADYVREAHNLAERTTAKYRHSFEASWLFVFALLFLGISIYLKIEALFYPDPGMPVEFETQNLLVLALLVFFHAALQIYTRVVHDRRSMQKARDFDTVTNLGPGKAPSVELRRNFESYKQRRWTPWLWLSAGGFSVWLALAPLDTCAGLIATAVVIGLTVGGPLGATRNRWDERRNVPMTLWRGLWPWPTIVTASAIAYATWAVAQDGLWRLLGILLPAACMSVFNIVRPGLAQWRTRIFERETTSPPVMRREVSSRQCSTCNSL